MWYQKQFLVQNHTFLIFMNSLCSSVIFVLRTCQIEPCHEISPMTSYLCQIDIIYTAFGKGGSGRKAREGKGFLVFGLQRRKETYVKQILWAHILQSGQFGPKRKQGNSNKKVEPTFSASYSLNFHFCHHLLYLSP